MENSKVLCVSILYSLFHSPDDTKTLRGVMCWQHRGKFIKTGEAHQ